MLLLRYHRIVFDCKLCLRGFAGVALFGLCLASACQSSAPAISRVERVVLTSLDGVGADLAWGWIEQGTASRPAGLRGMAEQGMSAQRLRMVNPTLTSVNHVSLVTGQSASGTGVVSNSFRIPGTTISRYFSGYSASSNATTLMEAARRQNRRVGTLVWPGADGGALDRMGDFGAIWPKAPLALSEVIEFLPENAATTGEVPSNDGLPPLLWRLRVNLEATTPSSVEALIALVDSEPDGRPRYDAVAARMAGTDEWRYFGEREWLELSFVAQAEEDYRPRFYSSWCKAVHIDRLRGTLRFYRGAPNRLFAYPAAFEDRLTEAIGPWPGTPDQDLLADWWLEMEEGIDLDTYLEQSERLGRYLDRMAQWVIRTEPFDLLLTYHPIADEYQHSSLIVDPLQWAFSPGRALAGREGLKRIGRSLDQSVSLLWNSLDQDRDALVVVSDHGMIPIFEVVGANRVLQEAGLLKVAGGNRPRLSSDSQMVATSSGACIHLYLNLKGREPGGVVGIADAPEVLRRAARVFADLEAEGRPAVEQIFTREEAATIGLDNPNTGDLVVFLSPGFTAIDRLDALVLEPSRYYGQHGYLAHHQEMSGIFFARGAGLKRSRQGEMSVTAVAPIVAALLGIEFTE